MPFQSIFRAFLTSFQGKEPGFTKNPITKTLFIFVDDENVVSLQPANGDLTQGLQYINASKIYDSDLRHVTYIATQAPLENTAAEFWQMVWEQVEIEKFTWKSVFGQ